jgi:hypothetical protein
MAAHAVGHDGQAFAGGKVERVLVVVTRDSDVGFAREANPHAVERKGGAHVKANGIACAGCISTDSRPDEAKGGSQLYRQVAARPVQVAVDGV